MQRNTFKPRCLIDRSGGGRWFLRRDEDGVLRYHKSATDRGRLPSAFFSESGTLKQDYRAA